MLDEKQASDEIESDVAELLRSLRRVDAPGDMLFGIRARIADRAPRGGLGWRAVLAFAMPLALLAAGVIAYLALLGGSPETVIDESAAVNAPILINAEPPSAAPEVAIETVATNRREVSATNSSAARPARAGSQALDVRDNRTTSTDEAAREGRRIMPRGMETRQRDGHKPRDFQEPVFLSPSDVLDQIGLKVVSVDGGLRVESVRDRSLAGRSGVRQGDVIEAIDDRKIDKNSMLSVPFNGRILKVVRDGTPVVVELKP